MGISMRREKMPVGFQILNVAGLTERLAVSAAYALTSLQAVTYLSLAGLLYSSFKSDPSAESPGPLKISPGSLSQRLQFMA